MKRALYIIVGLFFALLAVTLFTGLYLGYPILAFNTPTPFWPNFIGFVVAIALSVWFFMRGGSLE
jgi:hypothetical protein